MLGEQGERAHDPAGGLGREDGRWEHCRHKNPLARAEVMDNQCAVCRDSGPLMLEGSWEWVSDRDRLGERIQVVRGLCSGVSREALQQSDQTLGGGPVRSC